jgi:hypothetical protein
MKRLTYAYGLDENQLNNFFAAALVCFSFSVFYIVEVFIKQIVYGHVNDL